MSVCAVTTGEGVEDFPERKIPESWMENCAKASKATQHTKKQNSIKKCRFQVSSMKSEQVYVG
jgi:hypothetical protein